MHAHSATMHAAGACHLSHLHAEAYYLRMSLQPCMQACSGMLSTPCDSHSCVHVLLHSFAGSSLDLILWYLPGMVSFHASCSSAACPQAAQAAWHVWYPSLASCAPCSYEELHSMLQYLRHVCKHGTAFSSGPGAHRLVHHRSRALRIAV